MSIRNAQDLCKLAEIAGYKDKSWFMKNQLLLKNGSFASSLLALIDDNPELLDLIANWINTNLLGEGDPEFSCSLLSSPKHGY